MKCLACDFGGSSVKHALIDGAAVIEEAGRLPAPLESAEAFVNTVGTLFDAYRGRIDGIAISLPGYIDPDSGLLSGSGVYSRLWGSRIPELLKERCPVPITVENDGKCGALSEAWKGALADCGDGAVIILGTGVGGGLIKNHHIHSGKDGAAGEFSYMIAHPGQYGFTNSMLMSVGMIGLTYRLCKAKNLDLSVQDSREILEAIDGAFPSEPRHEKPAAIKADGRRFFEWVDAGDVDAREIYHDFIIHLAALVNNIQVVYAPEKIVIGGGLSEERRIFDDLREELDRYYSSMGIESPAHAVIVRSGCKSETNLLGAAYNFFNRTGMLDDARCSHVS